MWKSKELVPSAYALVSPHDKVQIMEISSGWQHLFGYSHEEMKGRSLRILQGPSSDLQGFNDLAKALKLCAPYDAVLTSYRKDGSSFLVHFRVASWLEDQPMMITAELRPMDAFVVQHFPDCRDELPDPIESSMNSQISSKSMVNRKERLDTSGFSSNPMNIQPATHVKDSIRLSLSRTSCQICKTLATAYRRPATESDATAVRSVVVEQCARAALRSVLEICGGRDGAELVLCEALLRAEEMPQVGRWHRRDLVPAALAAWNSALQAIARARQRGDGRTVPSATHADGEE